MPKDQQYENFEFTSTLAKCNNGSLQQLPCSGTYFPVISGETGLVVTRLGRGFFTKVGDIVHFSFCIVIEPTSPVPPGGPCLFFTLPIPTSTPFQTTEDVVTNVTSDTNNFPNAIAVSQIFTLQGSSRLVKLFLFGSGDLLNTTFYISGMYSVNIQPS